LPQEIVIHIDGAAKGNPGPASIGVIAHNLSGNVLFEHSRYIGETTNNVAEYRALIEALALAKEHGAQTIQVASDSQLLVRQMNGIYQVKKPHLKELYDQASRLLQNFTHVEIFHVPREQNKEADALANLAIIKQNNSTQNQ
jgi:ribonuclease HI